MGLQNQHARALLNADGSLMTTISMGKLNDEQEAVLRNFVMGYNVHDIGSGQLGLSRKLIELGAHTVTAIDKLYADFRNNNFKDCAPWVPPHPGITLVGEYFEEYASYGHFIDVAFVSWPEAYHPDNGLVALLTGVRTVIYLGTNFDGTACGSIALFQHLSRRNILATVPHKWNTLLVYGNEQQTRRLLPEEYAALHRDGAYFKFGDDLDL